jgi:GNAT superfamily N-acetyltransferase
MKEYFFERLTPGHYPLLKDLYLDAFNLRTGISDIEKRFDTLKLGCEQIGFITIHAQTGMAVAYFGVFPLKAIIDNTTILVAQAGDIMTHQAHRKRGLIVELAKATYEECERKGIKILFTQPNKQFYHGLVKSLGWTHLDEIIRWDLKLKFKTFPLSKIANRSGRVKKIYQRYARYILRNIISKEPSSFNNTISTDYIKVLRDSAYLQYKKSNNNFFLRIEKLTIWVNLADVFWIGDFDNFENITPATLRRIKKIAFLLGFNTISFNLNRTIPLPDVLKNFKEGRVENSCFLYVDKELEGKNFLITAADFDTW